MDSSALLFSLSSFIILSVVLFYVSVVLKEVKIGDGKPIISLFLKELGSKQDRRYSVVPPQSIDVSKESELPNGWFSDEQIFNLEKRAIFSKVGTINRTYMSLN